MTVDRNKPYRCAVCFGQTNFLNYDLVCCQCENYLTVEEKMAPFEMYKQAVDMLIKWFPEERKAYNIVKYGPMP